MSRCDFSLDPPGPPLTELLHPLQVGTVAHVVYLCHEQSTVASKGPAPWLECRVSTGVPLKGLPRVILKPF